MKFLTRTLNAAAVIFLCSFSTVQAQTTVKPWPNKTIRIIVGFSAGSVTDTVARVMAEQMSKSLGQAVIVENKPGANGALAVAEVARAAPDGYTLVVTNSSSIAINPQLYKQITYKASDFIPVVMGIEAPFVLTVNPEWAKNNNINLAKDLINFAQTHPDKLSYGSTGQGSLGHLSFVSWSNLTGIKTTHIPYKSASQAQLAAISGEINALFDTPNAMPHIQAGKLKPLAVTSPKRIAQLPEVPTMIEAGYKNFEVTFWLGMLAPAGTPQPIVQEIYDAVKKISTDNKAMAALQQIGDPVLLEPIQFAARVKSEVPFWGDVIRRENLVLD